jgi:hypothetical protein
MTPRPFIRQLLTRYPDGLTAREIAEHYAEHKNKTYKQVKAAIDGALHSETKVAYIDRYASVKYAFGSKDARRHSYKWAAVWCLIDWPEDAPRPTTKAGEYGR